MHGETILNCMLLYLLGNFEVSCILKFLSETRALQNIELYLLT